MKPLKPPRHALAAARVVLTAALLAGCDAQPSSSTPPAHPSPATTRTHPVSKTDAQWKQELTAEQYRVLREKGTERAFTGRYWNEHRPGAYVCAACGKPLYDAATKFDSGTGWPSFYAPIQHDAVATQPDDSHGMVRTEALCASCGGHLGHVFNDGPGPTGLRHCINSASLKFEPQEDAAPHE